MALPVDSRVVAFALYAAGKLTTLSLNAADLAVEVQPELKTFTRVGDVFAE
jgi:hypothetical protein